MSCKWFLFLGPSGTGKSQLIRDIIKAHGVDSKNVLHITKAIDFFKNFDRSVHTDVVCEEGIGGEQYRHLLTLYPHPRRFYVAVNSTLDQWASDDETRIIIRTYTHCLWEPDHFDADSQKIRLFVKSDSADIGSIVEIHRNEAEQSWSVEPLLERMRQ